MNPVLKLLRSHRSIRKFKDRPVKEDTLRAILRAAQCAATSNFLQAYTVIRVADRENRQAIAELSGDQVWVAQAPVFLVFCADLNRLALACRMNRVAMADGYAEQLIVATVDTALFCQNTMVTAESIGLGGVFIGGIRNHPQRVCDLLDIPDQAYPVFGMCLGYPDRVPPSKPRLPLASIFKEEVYSLDGEEERLRAYDEKIRAYYLGRDSNLRDETWTGQMAAFMPGKVRPHMKAFLEKKGFWAR